MNRIQSLFVSAFLLASGTALAGNLAVRVQSGSAFAGNATVHVFLCSDTACANPVPPQDIEADLCASVQVSSPNTLIKTTCTTSYKPKSFLYQITGITCDPPDHTPQNMGFLPMTNATLVICTVGGTPVLSLKLGAGKF